jgi:hypothetical protein
VAEDFDERVLDGLVGFGGVAQILKRDSQGATLMGRDQAFEANAGGVEIALLDQRAPPPEP